MLSEMTRRSLLLFRTKSWLCMRILTGEVEGASVHDAAILLHLKHISTGITREVTYVFRQLNAWWLWSLVLNADISS